MPKITFFSEDIDYSLSSKKEIMSWIKDVIKLESRTLSSLNFIFCSDTYLHKINLDYLNHDTYTDIVTFDNSENLNEIEGDIFISIDRVKENANVYERPADEELQRVIIHGVLHLVGYSDKSDLEQREMTIKEEACLSLRKF